MHISKRFLEEWTCSLGALRANSIEHCTLLVNAALDQNPSRAKYLLEEDYTSVLIYSLRHVSHLSLLSVSIFPRIGSTMFVGVFPATLGHCFYSELNRIAQATHHHIHTVTLR